MSAPEPLWRWEQWHDALGNAHTRWMPSNRLNYLLGCLLKMQADIEKVTMARPTMVLLPADETPAEAVGGGTLMGLPFEVTDKVKAMSIVYEVQSRMEVLG